MTRKVDTPEGQSKMVSLVNMGRVGYENLDERRNNSAMDWGCGHLAATMVMAESSNGEDGARDRRLRSSWPPYCYQWAPVLLLRVDTSVSQMASP